MKDRILVLLGIAVLAATFVVGVLYGPDAGRAAASPAPLPSTSASRPPSPQPPPQPSKSSDAPAPAAPPTPSPPAAPNAAAGPAIEPLVVASYSGGGITIGGTVPDAAVRDRLLKRAAAIYGTQNVRDDLRIDPRAQARWLATDALYGPVQALGSPRISYDGRTLRLEGLVASRAARARAEADARAQMPGEVKIDNLLRVSAAPPAPAAARSAAAPASESGPPPDDVERRIRALLQLDPIHFVTNTNELTPDSRAVLERIAKLLDQQPNLRFEIGGHTDGRGDARMNRALSRTRAQAVVDALVAQGLARDRFVVRGYGATRPIANDATAQGRQANRRIEFRQIGA